MRFRRVYLPLAGFVLGSGVMTATYFGIVTLAEGPDHAAAFFLDELRFILPLILGFGVQSSLYVILKKQLFVRVEHAGPSGAMIGAGGTSSTLAIIACCVHHVTDVLPILGASAAATILAEYQRTFMFIGLMTTLIGIVVMIGILIRERRKVLGHLEMTLGNKRSFGKSYLALGLAIGVVGLALFASIAPKASSEPKNVTVSSEPQSAPATVFPQVLKPIPSNTTLWFSSETRIDKQGAVVVEVTPLHLNQQNRTLYFGIAMNTHSVDLSMDLAELAVLTLDDNPISASLWNGPTGGHHISGVLSFELASAEVDLVLNSRNVELVLANVDAAERTFVWRDSN